METLLYSRKMVEPALTIARNLLSVFGRKWHRGGFKASRENSQPGFIVGTGRCGGSSPSETKTNVLGREFCNVLVALGTCRFFLKPGIYRCQNIYLQSDAKTPDKERYM